MKWFMMAVLAFFAAPQTQGQQVTKAGTTAAKFLSIPVGARALAMGGAFAAVADDASAIYWNPAGISGITQNEAILSHSRWIAGISFNFAGFVLPLGDNQSLGISLTSLSMGEMERTTETQPDGTGEFFSAGSVALGITYARNLTEWFSIGGTVKYVSEHIWNSTATGIAVDIGTLFVTPFPGLKFGAGISNFGEKLQMNGDDLLVQKDISQNAGNNPNINANLSTDRFDMPLNLRIGFAYEAMKSEEQSLILVVDASHPSDNSESINLGGEYTVLSGLLSVRGGYKGLGMTESEEQYTLGGGVMYDVAEG
ncbi:MAG: PorV/PorQ family protein, partial [Bacteroidota bacterium]